MSNYHDAALAFCQRRLLLSVKEAKRRAMNSSIKQTLQKVGNEIKETFRNILAEPFVGVSFEQCCECYSDFVSTVAATLNVYLPVVLTNIVQSYIPEKRCCATHFGQRVSEYSKLQIESFEQCCACYDEFVALPALLRNIVQSYTGERRCCSTHFMQRIEKYLKFNLADYCCDVPDAAPACCAATTD